jgi:hypothetical protein
LYLREIGVVVAISLVVSLFELVVVMVTALSAIPSWYLTPVSSGGLTPVSSGGRRKSGELLGKRSPPHFPSWHSLDASPKQNAAAVIVATHEETEADRVTQVLLSQRSQVRSMYGAPAIIEKWIHAYQIYYRHGQIDSRSQNLRGKWPGRIRLTNPPTSSIPIRYRKWKDAALHRNIIVSCSSAR